MSPETSILAKSWSGLPLCCKHVSIMLFFNLCPALKYWQQQYYVYLHISMDAIRFIRLIIIQYNCIISLVNSVINIYILFPK